MDDAKSVGVEILLRYYWTAEEAGEAFRWHFHQGTRPALRWVLWLLGASLIVMGSLELARSKAFAPGGLLLLAGLYLLLMLLMVRPWLARRRFAKRPDQNLEMEWRISAERLRVESSQNQTEFVWETLSKVVQTPSGHLLYFAPQVFLWLPRSAFASEADFHQVSEIAQGRGIRWQRLH